ncbi:MAG: dioxygenase [Thiomonas sp.]|nr:dioxygenase [Thiomonas sp.]
MTASPLPTLFVSHGSPMLPLEPGTAGPMLQALGRDLPRPEIILAFSPHWMAREPTVGTSARPETVHDFGGFDRALYALQYPAPGAPQWAPRVERPLRQAGWQVHEDPHRGLDHGIWSPLRLMYPEADVPVVPLAMPWPLDAAGAYRLGAALAPLTEQGALLLGTGSLTHNLREFDPAAPTDEAPAPYVQAFVDWVRGMIDRGDTEALLDYRRRAPHAARAHPTDEHLLPLFWALGAAGAGARPRHHVGGVHYGSLSMDAWTFHPG